MKEFTSIESFTHLVRKAKSYATYLNIPVQALPPMEYRGTVKLDGTNASVSVAVNGNILAHSRTQTLTPENRNMGWYTFAIEEVQPIVWQELAKLILLENGITEQTETVTIYGEWCGKGIQKGTALVQCPKHFVMFGAAHGDVMLESLRTMEVPNVMIYNVNRLPAFTLTIDFAKLDDISEKLNELTKAVEDCCPWAKAVWGVEGVGEGIVWVPVGKASETSWYFKTKGSKHAVRNNPNKNVAPVDVEKVNSIRECVNIILTENRMEQMVRDHNIPMDLSATGTFLKAVCQDCMKEEMAVVEENGLEWKDVGKLVQSIARDWFKDKVTRSILNLNG